MVIGIASWGHARYGGSPIYWFVASCGLGSPSHPIQIMSGHRGHKWHAMPLVRRVVPPGFFRWGFSDSLVPPYTLSLYLQTFWRNICYGRDKKYTNILNQICLWAEVGKHLVLQVCSHPTLSPPPSFSKPTTPLIMACSIFSRWFWNQSCSCRSF